MSASVAATAETIKEKKKPNLFVEIVTRLVKEKPLGTIGGVIVVILFITAIFADVLAPYGMNEMILSDRLLGPSLKHWLGTDNLGRDLLSRIIYGARISMYIGFGATTLHTVVATLIAFTAYWGGKMDIIVQRFVDAVMALPYLFLLLTVMAVVGPGIVQVICVLGIQGGIRASRTERSAVISVKQNVYFEAARAIGASTSRILMVHVLPNIMPVIIITFTIGIGGMILAESTLSFLGFGVPPPTPAWGGMLSGSGRKYMLFAPWMCVWPGLALALVVFGMNMLGDGVRDILDPRLRGGLGRYQGVLKKIEKKAKAVGVTTAVKR